MTISRKKILMLALASIALLLWAYHFTRLEIELPATHVDGLLVCSPEYNSGPFGQSEQELAASFNIYNKQFQDSLAASANPDAKVMAAVVSNPFDNDSRIVELDDLVAAYPDNRLANLHFQNACVKNTSHPLCDEDGGAGNPN